MGAPSLHCKLAPLRLLAFCLITVSLGDGQSQKGDTPPKHMRAFLRGSVPTVYAMRPSTDRILICCP